MAKYKNALIFIVLICIISNIFVFAVEDNAPKNLEIIQLRLLENNECVLSVLYGYPIDNSIPEIEKEDLINDEFLLSISELTIDDVNRYAALYCTIRYQNTEDLLAKIQKITEFESDEYKTTLFNFYVLLDSVAKNLNVTAVEQDVISLTIDTSSFVNQKYYMTHLDSAIINKFTNIDTKTMRDVDTYFYLITPSNVIVSDAEQFKHRELNDIYSEYSCSLNNQKLSITLGKKTEQEIVPIDENSFEAKLNQFLESKYYNLFIVGCCVFIILAIIIMIVIAKSYTKAIEKEEKRKYAEEHKHDKNAPMLYWTQDERESENKKKKMLKNPNTLVRDCDLDNVESIENTQYKRQSNFK